MCRRKEGCFFKPGGVMRPDLEATIDSPVEYCVSARYYKDGPNKIEIFDGLVFCGSEVVNAEDATVDDDGARWHFTAEVAAVKRLISRIENATKER
jgi:hypothetical protein